MVESGLDLTVHFGRQVRYQCAKDGCRRYFKVEDGQGICTHCGTLYYQYPDATFAPFFPEAVPA